jgi:glucose dehydrogenase
MDTTDTKESHVERSTTGLASAAAVAMVFGIVAIHGADARKTREWPSYSAALRSTKYSPLDQINKDTIGRRPEAAGRSSGRWTKQAGTRFGN